MDYKKLAADLLSGCEENCADCEYAGDSEFECTIAQLAATAITDLIARAEAAEARMHDLETTHRTEMCENGYDCVELGKARKALEAAEKELAECREKNAGLALALLTEQPPNSDCIGDQEWQAVRNHVREAEARAEKAERERDEALEVI